VPEPSIPSTDPTTPAHPTPIHVIGLLGGEPVGEAARHALGRAALVTGSRDQLHAAARWIPGSATRLVLRSGLAALDALDALGRCETDDTDGRTTSAATTCVLASGDPGVFGIVASLSRRFGTERLRVYPAPSSVSLAFARLGLPWDDAVVLSVHARDLDAAIPVLRAATKAAVLVSPEHPAQAVGAALRAAGTGHRRVAVCTRLGEPGESVTVTDLDGLADGSFDPRCVVVLVAEAAPPRPGWGRDVDAFAHRASMITKPEVRAAVLGRLDLPDRGVLWDLGAGSGSVAIEAALASPGLRVIAVERRPDDVARLHANAEAFGALVDIVEAEALEVLAGLPKPDRVFVGGGGLDVLDAARSHLGRDGVMVATFAAADRAIEAYRRLGHLVQVTVDRADDLPDGGVRFVAENPVFVAWGTGTDHGADEHTDEPARDGGVVVGVGCSTGATAADTGALVSEALAAVGLGRDDVSRVATIDQRRHHDAISGLGWPVDGFSAQALAGVPVPHPSDVVLGHVGTPSVAEAAALAAAGPGATLVAAKRRNDQATVAIARPPAPAPPSKPESGAEPSSTPGRLTVVGLGPGHARHRTPAATGALRAADIVLGYGPYVDQCADILRSDQVVYRSAMGDEAARARAAVIAAQGGAHVAIVSSGDAGVFSMASVTLELAAELAPSLDVTVIPGVTAAHTAAALVGAPLAHDHAAISLSDRLTPWATIEARLVAAADSDFVLALYNPRSRDRTGHLDAARDIVLGARGPDTPVALVTNAARPGESVTITTLGDLDARAVGMNTVVLIGSSTTAVMAGRMVTPRHHPRPEAPS
jgi:precorrin-3B C17-methyltransferase/precorrin-6y C5,15-methyltransferase (decarboxylating) CbiE subunit/precorrin-6Y C5,15-methyltransferase (decarboxylating) CbiT subunit